MNRADWFQPKWKWLRRLSFMAFLGVVTLVFLPLNRESSTRMVAISAIAFALFAPFIFWLAFVPVMHWRERYKGRHPYLWGAFLVFETSGWSKIVYWFMHVLPDWRKDGLYQEEP